MSTMTYEEQANRIKALEKEKQALREKIAELERRLGLNTQNSSQPPQQTDLRRNKEQTSFYSSSQGGSSGFFLICQDLGSYVTFYFYKRVF